MAGRLSQVGCLFKRRADVSNRTLASLPSPPSSLPPAGPAVSEITNDGWIERLHRDLPRITPEDAGRNLARIAAAHDLTLYAYYIPDYVGHRGTWDEAVESLERFDRCLAGLLEGLPDDALLIVASDHGNIEDTTREHTENLALGLVVGLGHAEVAERMEHLWDVPAAILEVLGVAPGDRTGN